MHHKILGSDPIPPDYMHLDGCLGRGTSKPVKHGWDNDSRSKSLCAIPLPQDIWVAPPCRGTQNDSVELNYLTICCTTVEDSTAALAKGQRTNMAYDEHNDEHNDDDDDEEDEGGGRGEEGGWRQLGPGHYFLSAGHIGYYLTGDDMLENNLIVKTIATILFD